MSLYVASNRDRFGLEPICRVLQVNASTVRPPLVMDKDRVARLLRELGIRGVVRDRKVCTTKSDPAAVRAPDLVKRVFTAERPNALWVSDFTYVPSWAGMVYVAFVLDVYSRFIVAGGHRPRCAPIWSWTR